MTTEGTPLVTLPYTSFKSNISTRRRASSSSPPPPSPPIPSSSHPARCGLPPSLFPRPRLPSSRVTTTTTTRRRMPPCPSYCPLPSHFSLLSFWLCFEDCAKSQLQKLNYILRARVRPAQRDIEVFRLPLRPGVVVRERDERQYPNSPYK